jgi:hypothetical protein
MAFVNEPGSGLYRASANDVRMSIGGSDNARWRLDGGVQKYELWNGAAWQSVVTAPPADSDGLPQAIIRNPAAGVSQTITVADPADVPLTLGGGDVSLSADGDFRTTKRVVSNLGTGSEISLESIGGFGIVRGGIRSGIRFGDGYVDPYRDGGANSVVDLGRSAVKWKDAYFSGTVDAGNFTVSNVPVVQTFTRANTATYREVETRFADGTMIISVAIEWTAPGGTASGNISFTLATPPVLKGQSGDGRINKYQSWMAVANTDGRQFDGNSPARTDAFTCGVIRNYDDTLNVSFSRNDGSAVVAGRTVWFTVIINGFWK